MFRFRSIRSQLLLSFIAFSVILIVAFFTFFELSFYQGLMQYVKEREKASVSKVAELMSSRVSRGDIQLRRIRHKQWHDTIRDALLSTTERDETGEWYTPSGMPFSDQRTSKSRPESSELRRSPSPDFSRPPPPPGRRTPPSGINERLSLVDLDRIPVFGQIWPSEEVIYFPILKEGREVAYVAFKPGKSVIERHEEEFFKQQTIGFMVISLGAFIVCVLIAWLLSNRIAKPLYKVTQTARSLSEGSYGDQIELSSYQGHKDDEVGQLIRDFNYLSRVLERNETSRLQWSSDIAHELRTPIAVLKGEIEAIMDGVRPASKESVASLQEEVVLLEKMVADLRQLTLSDAGALDYHMADVELNQVAMSVSSSMSLLFEKAQLKFNYRLIGQPVAMQGDKERLRQLLNNLLTNSIRYTDGPGDVFLTLRVNDKGQELTLEDSTPGVPDDALPKLFDRLYRVDKSRSRSSGGSGLGLAICSNIVDAHGGKIVCSHSSLGGLKVTISFDV